MRRIYFIFTVFFFAFSGLARAAEPLPDIKTVETYLNSITTLRAQFVQTDYAGAKAAGTFLLKRPGKMRFEYAPPLEDFIVADGIFIYYYDSKMQQQSNVPIGQSLADFFLRPKLELGRDLRLSGIKREEGLLWVTLVQAEDPLAGSLSMLFTENPLQLKGWRVLDVQGLMTAVDLVEIESGIKLSNELFHYYDPARKKGPYGAN